MSNAAFMPAQAASARRRIGTTLVEVMGTLSVLFVLGISSANLLRAITDVGAYNAHRQQVRDSVVRLSEKFRLDVENARRLSVQGDSWPIEMTTAGATIRYDWDRQSHAIERSASQGQQISGVERFQLSQQCQAEVDIDDDRVTLKLSEGKSSQPWIIEAYQQ